MMHHLKPLWDVLFHPERAARKVPRWLAAVGRFTYLCAQEFSRNRCLEKASALGFQTVFSMIPALAIALFFFQAFGAFDELGAAVQRFLYRQLNVDMITISVSEVGEPISLADKIQGLVEGAIRLLRAPEVRFVSFTWLLIATMSLALTMERSLNAVWGAQARRGLIRRVAMYWTLLTLGTLLLGLSIHAAQWFGAGFGGLDFIVGALVPLTGFYLLYQFVPHAPARAHAALAGAVAATLLWEIHKILFGLYVSYAVGYGRLYGNLGLIPLFLFWVWIAWVIVLIGAVFAYTFQNMDRLSVEERRRHGAPFVQPGLIAVGLVLDVARAFQTGKGSVGANELADVCQLPDQLWIQLVDLLESRGILHEVGPAGDRYALARPPDSLRVEDVFASVEQDLVLRPEERWDANQNRLRELSRALTEARQRQLGDTTFADLLGERPPVAFAEPQRQPA